MAVSVRELFLIVRARDEASSTLRRVSGNIERLRTLKSLPGQITATQTALRNSEMQQLQHEEALNKAYKAKQQLMTDLTAAQGTLASAQQRYGVQQEHFSAAQQLYNRNMAQGIPVTKQMDANVNRFAKSSMKANEQVKQASDHVGRLNKGITSLSNSMVSNGRAAYGAAQQTAYLNQELKDQITLQDRLLRENKLRAAQSTSAFGRNLQLAGGIGLAAAGFAANAAADFSSKVTLAATQTGALNRSWQSVGETVNKIMPEILRQMKVYPASADDMTSATYDIFSSLDVTLPQGMKLLETFNKAAVGGLTDVTTVADAGISVLNDYGKSAGSLNTIMSRMFAAVRFGRMTFAEFSQSLGQTVAPLAAAGQSFDVLAGTMAFLTRKIPSVAKASVALSRSVEVLGRASFIEGVRKAGVEITNLHGKLLPLPIIVDKLTQKFPQLTKGGTFLQQFIKEMSGTEGTIQARRGLTFLFQDVKGYHSILQRVIGDNKEFGRSYQAMAATSGQQWKVFLNTIHALWIELGQAVMPALIELTAPLRKVVKYLEDMDAGTRKTLGRIIVFGSALALLGGTFLTITAAVVSFVAILGVAEGAFAGFATVLKTGTVIGAVALLIVNNWDQVRVIFEKVYDVLRPFIDLIKSIPAPIQEWALTTGALVVIGYKMVTMIQGALGGMAAFRVEMLAMSAATLDFDAALLAMNINPVILALTAVAAVTVGAVYWISSLGDTTYGLTQKQKALTDQAKALTKVLKEQIGVLKTAPQDYGAIIEARAQVASTRAEIDKAKADVKAAKTAKELRAAHLELALAYNHNADALDGLRTAQNKWADDTAKISRVMETLNDKQDVATRTAKKLADAQKALSGLYADARAAGRPGQVGVKGAMLADQIEQLTKNLKNQQGVVETLTGKFNRYFDTMIRGFEERHLIPHIDETTNAMLKSFATVEGHIPTIPEIKQIVTFSTKGLDGVKHANKYVQDFARYWNTHDIPISVKPHPDHDKIVGLFSQLGRDITNGIVAGTFHLGENLYASLSAGALSALHHTEMLIKKGSPSKLFAEQIGLPIAQGIALGVDMGNKDINRAMTNAVSVPRIGMRGGGGGRGGDTHYHLHQNITANKDETYDRSMKKAFFLYKNVGQGWARG